MNEIEVGDLVMTGWRQGAPGGSWLDGWENKVGLVVEIRKYKGLGKIDGRLYRVMTDDDNTWGLGINDFKLLAKGNGKQQ